MSFRHTEFVGISEGITKVISEITHSFTPLYAGSSV